MRQLKPHGTWGAYKRHIRHRPPEVPCEACREFVNTEGREAHRRKAAARRRALTNPFDQLLDLIAGECRRAGMLP